jgi:hypothetical protein
VGFIVYCVLVGWVMGVCVWVPRGLGLGVVIRIREDAVVSHVEDSWWV